MSRLPNYCGAASDLDWREAIGEDDRAPRLRFASSVTVPGPSADPVGECDHNTEPPPTTDRDPGDENPEPVEHFDLRDYRQSLIDQQWKGR